MVVSEQGYGKRSDIEDYRKTNRGGKGVKTMNITEKTGKLVTIKSVTDENDLMIINKSGITIRLKVADVRIMCDTTNSGSCTAHYANCCFMETYCASVTVGYDDFVVSKTT